MRNKKITLESTAIEFNKWREKRKAGESVPDTLWKMVADIYDHYPHTLLCQKLNLRIAQLKSKGFEPNSDDFVSATPEEDKSSDFVHVTPVQEIAVEKPVVNEIMPAIEIHRPDGVKIIFKPNSNEHFSNILQQFIGA